MTKPSHIETPEGRRIAYHRTVGAGPGVVFLGGFMSIMDRRYRVGAPKQSTAAKVQPAE